MDGKDKGMLQRFWIRRVGTPGRYSKRVLMESEGLYEGYIELNKGVISECVLVDYLPLWVDAKSEITLTSWVFSTNAPKSIEPSRVVISSSRDCLWLRYVPGTVYIHSENVNKKVHFLVSHRLTLLDNEMQQIENDNGQIGKFKTDDRLCARNEDSSVDYLTFRFSALISSGLIPYFEVSHPGCESWATVVEAFEGELLDVRVVCVNNGTMIRHGVVARIGTWNAESARPICKTVAIRTRSKDLWGPFYLMKDGLSASGFVLGDIEPQSGVEVRFKMRVGTNTAMSSLEMRFEGEEDILSRTVGIWPRAKVLNHTAENECFNEAEKIRNTLGGEPDLGRMIELYCEASRDEPKAFYALGCCAEYGMGLEANDELAYKLYLSAAKAGVSEAQQRVGSCLYYGRGVDRDRSAAYRFYLLAALGGNTQACYSVARCLELGEGTDKNLSKARFYYAWAAKHGHNASSLRLSVLQ